MKRTGYAIGFALLTLYLAALVAVLPQGPARAQSFVQQRPALASSVSAMLDASDQTVVSAPSSGQLKLRGWSIANDSGSAASIAIYDGTTSVSTTVLAQIRIADAGDDHHDIIGGAFATGGIYVTTDQTVELTIFYDQ